jgi:hypothetical protein
LRLSLTTSGLTAASWLWDGVFGNGREYSSKPNLHCIWRDAHGSLLDITNKNVKAPRILFLPDPVRRAPARQIDNRRKPSTAIVKSPATWNSFSFSTRQRTNARYRAMAQASSPPSNPFFTKLKSQRYTLDWNGNSASVPPNPGKKSHYLTSIGSRS